MEAEWDSLRATLERLYLAEDRPLNQIMTYMEKGLDFKASKYQYERHFKQWKFRKNLLNTEWKFVHCRIQKRTAVGKKSDVYFNGTLIPGKRLNKEISRHCPPTFEQSWASSPSPGTPEGISVSTPKMTPRLDIIFETLPWFQLQEFLDAQVQFFHEPILNRPSGNMWPIDRYSGFLPDAPPSSGFDFNLELDSNLYAWQGQTALTYSNPHIPTATACSILEILTGNKVIKKQSWTWKDILPHLQAILPERDPEKSLTSIQNALEPFSGSALLDFFKLTMYLLSNNLMDTEQVDQFIEWVIECNHRAVLVSFLSVRLPSIEALAHIMFRSAVRLGDTQLVQILIDADIESILSSISLLEGDPPLLHLAIGTRNVQLIRILLASGASTNGYWRWGKTTVMEAAASKNSIEMVQVLFSAGADLNFGPHRLNSSHALQAAAYGCDIALARLLLEKGADVNAPADHNYGTALQEATKRPNTELVQLLLENGADVNAPADRRYGTALQEAAKRPDIELVQLLLNAGADVNAPACGFHRTVIHEAVRAKSVEMVQLLLSFGADITQTSEHYGTAVQEAARGTKVELVQLLFNDSQNEASYVSRILREVGLRRTVETGEFERIQHYIDLGVDVNIPFDDENPSLLVFAARKRKVKLVMALLEAGADTNDPSTRLKPTTTAVQAVVESIPSGDAEERCCWMELLQILLDAGADINQYANNGFNNTMTALQNAARVHDKELVEWLLRKGADVNALPGCCREWYAGLGMVKQGTALQLAAGKWGSRDIELLRLLLEAGAHVNAPAGEPYGRTALQAAAWMGWVDAVQLLLDFGADVNAPGSRGRDGLTALKAAVSASYMGDNISLVRLLLKSGANVDDRGSSNSWCGSATPLQIAAEGTNKGLIRLLLDNGADVNISASYFWGRTALQAAASADYGSTEIIQILLNAGADVNAPAADEFGVTALQGAAISGYIGIALMLLEAGAEVNAPAGKSDGRTAIEGAAEHGRLDMVQLLLNAGAGTDALGIEKYGEAVALAEKEGHYAVAGFLKDSLKDNLSPL